MRSYVHDGTEWTRGVGAIAAADGPGSPSSASGGRGRTVRIVPRRGMAGPPPRPVDRTRVTLAKRPTTRTTFPLRAQLQPHPGTATIGGGGGITGSKGGSPLSAGGSKIGTRPLSPLQPAGSKGVTTGIGTPTAPLAPHVASPGSPPRILTFPAPTVPAVQTYPAPGSAWGSGGGGGMMFDPGDLEVAELIPPETPAPASGGMGKYLLLGAAAIAAAWFLS